MSGLPAAVFAAALSFSLVAYPAYSETPATDLPDGAGKDLIASVCTACHTTRQILRSSGYSSEQWNKLTGTMVDLSGNPADRDNIIAYLAQHFPPNSKRTPKLITGPHRVEFKEWQVPTLGQRARDPIEAADGMIWYVNSGQGRLGRYDPKSGEIKEWASPSGPKSHPYAIAVINGIVWYNESGKRPDALVRFDPKSETFQSWAVPSGGIYAGIIRHMRATRDGNLLIHQSSTNRITLVRLQHK